MKIIDSEYKTCPNCRELKKLDEFHNCTKAKSGKRTYCKVCTLVMNDVYFKRNPQKLKTYRTNYRFKRRRTLEGFLAGLYSNMRARVMGVKGQKPFYAGLEIMSRKDFINFGKNDKSFQRLFNYWLRNGMERADVPSINRINPELGYIHGNCEFIQQRLNSSQTRNNKRYFQILVENKVIFPIAEKVA